MEGHWVEDLALLRNRTLYTKFVRYSKEAKKKKRHSLSITSTVVGNFNIFSRGTLSSLHNLTYSNRKPQFSILEGLRVEL